VNSTVTSALSVLVIDDEPQIQRLLGINLEAAGYRVTFASDGQQGLTLAAQKRPDAIILDLGLPGLSGLEVLKRLREWTQVPVVILTVQDGETEKIAALDGGADDYVTKPFHTGELLARLRAALRRSHKGTVDEPVFRVGELAVDLAARRVTRAGQPVMLPATEYNLLRLFIQHAGKVLTHRHLLQEVWGPEHQGQMAYLRVYLLRLREKLETDPAKPRLLLTEPGVGYRLVNE
jgi:two-component system KDP operon response regulator KdpE